MQAALIALTIFGCDDSLRQCTYLATLDHRSESVAACDKATDRALRSYSGQPYPSIIALCEAPKVEQAAQVPQVPPLQTLPPAPPQAASSGEEGLAGLANRVSRLVLSTLPSREDLKGALRQPVHVVTEGYSWAIRRLTP